MEDSLSISSAGNLKITPRLKIGMGVVFALLLLQYAVFPLLDWQRAFVRKTVSLNTTVARKKNLIGQEQAIEKSLETATSYRNELLQRFDADINEPQALQLNFQKRVEELTKTIQVKVVSVDWLPATKGDVIRVPIKIRIEATPDEFIKLVNAIETSPKFRTVDSMRLTTRSQSPTITAEMDISAYGLLKQ